MTYRGRFAPSPTGPLHFGSLLAALASYCDAKSAGGEWLLRIDDIDPLREQKGASDGILRTLEQHGLHWDGPVCYQSRRTEAYRAALATLQQQNLLFYCTCTRQQLAAFGNSYPGTCRQQFQPPSQAYAIRLKVPDRQICLDDLLQGRYCQNLQEEGGDFVLVRKEG
ncbi:MAG TPA: glutamate--tRNA ligase family protein, partial [Pseudomonadales bacterium]|nr:glutamate--tRNA ligase family protein [Pseudomonadales bacterium]